MRSRALETRSPASGAPAKKSRHRRHGRRWRRFASVHQRPQNSSRRTSSNEPKSSDPGATTPGAGSDLQSRWHGDAVAKTSRRGTLEKADDEENRPPKHARGSASRPPIYADSREPQNSSAGAKTGPGSPKGGDDSQPSYSPRRLRPTFQRAIAPPICASARLVM